MRNPDSSSAAAPPYGRWFFWLLLASVLCLSNPWFHSPDERFYSPAIGTYVETADGMAPATMKVLLDGRTYGELTASFWIECGLFIIGVEALVFAIRRFRK